VEGTEVLVEPEGRVVVDGAVAGQLRLATAAPGAFVRKEGALRFAVDGAIVAAGPDAVRVRQGRLEDGNVDTMLGMVDMIAVQRAYAMNVQALTGLDATLSTVTNQVGRVQ
jgi:flagellar basal body rod protein FlgG